MPALQCCHLEDGRANGKPCGAPAEWEIAFGPKFSIHEATHACSKHVGDLLSDADEHLIFRLGKRISRTTEFATL